MPQIFKIGSYWVFFWANESDPLDPVHVYVCEGAPNANATKIWVTRAGKCYLYHNYSRIPERTRFRLFRPKPGAFRCFCPLLTCKISGSVFVHPAA